MPAVIQRYWARLERRKRVRCLGFAVILAISVILFLTLAFSGAIGRVYPLAAVPELPLRLFRGFWYAGETLPLFMGLTALGIWYTAETLWTRSRRWTLLACAALAIGLLLRLQALPVISHDYTTFLSKWVQEFRDGGLATFRSGSSNYNVLYQYILYLISLLPVSDLLLIKLVSVIGDLLLAVTGMRLARHIVPGRPAPAALALSLLWLVPTYWLNSAEWAQCDSLYGALCLMALLYILKGRPLASVVAGSLAFAFKLQAVFFLPMFVIFLIARRVRLYHAIYFPVVMVATSLPAAFLGMRLTDIFGVYFGQAAAYSYGLQWNAPSWYALFNNDYIAKAQQSDTLFSSLFNAGLWMAFASVLALWGLAFWKRRTLDDRLLVMFSAAMTLLIPFLLPAMHDRYYYLPEIFTVMAAVLCWKRAPLAVMTFLGSYGGYHAYLRRQYFLQNETFSRMQGSAFCMLIAVILGILCLAVSLWKTREHNSAESG